MLDKLKAFYAVFEAGKTVANKQAWRTHQVSANAVTVFLFALVSLAKAFGYDFGIDMQTCADIGVGALALINTGITIATSSHLGIQPSLPSAPVREAQPAVPSIQQAEPHSNYSVEPSPVQPIDEAPAGQPPADAIDEATRARAIAWVREHSTNNSNGLQNDA
jgi:hypothetical protein